MDEDKQDYRRIKKFDETVVNKIDVGEIIIQPANSLKKQLAFSSNYYNR
jgi:DNA mismatch repair ATPase MutL